MFSRLENLVYMKTHIRKLYLKLVGKMFSLLYVCLTVFKRNSDSVTMRTVISWTCFNWGGQIPIFSTTKPILIFFLLFVHNALIKCKISVFVLTKWESDNHSSLLVNTEIRISTPKLELCMSKQKKKLNEGFLINKSHHITIPNPTIFLFKLQLMNYVIVSHHKI